MYELRGLGDTSRCAKVVRFYDVESGAMPDKPCPEGKASISNQSNPCEQYHACVDMSVVNPKMPNTQDGTMEDKMGMFLAAAGAGIVVYLLMRR